MAWRDPMKRHRWGLLKGERPHADDDCRDCTAQRRDRAKGCWSKGQPPALYDPSQGAPDDPEAWARRHGFSSHAAMARALRDGAGPASPPTHRLVRDEAELAIDRDRWRKGRLEHPCPTCNGAGVLSANNMWGLRTCRDCVRLAGVDPRFHWEYWA